MRVLGVLYTSNRVNKKLLDEVVRQIDNSRQYALQKGLTADVIVSSWEAMTLPDGMENMVMPFHEGGHLNILLQLSKVLNIYKRRYPDEKTLVCFLEHDVLYHATYMHAVSQFFKQKGEDIPGVNARGFVGLNPTGYCTDVWKHYPLSMMSADIDYLLPHVEDKIQECLTLGSCVIEPDRTLFEDYIPRYPLAIHVNCDQTEHNHHFTNHYDSYEKQSTMPAVIGSWPHVTYYTEKFFGVAVQRIKTALPEDLVFVNAQPAQGKFLWQVAVQLMNFTDHGIPQERCYFVMIKQDNLSKKYDDLKVRWPGVHWIEVEDDRPAKKYISSVRPYALAKLFDVCPELTGKNVFYFDSDIIFRDIPDFASMVSDGFCHLSDTVGYIGYKYLIKFGEDYVNAMCSMVGIDRQVVQDNEANSGGAQYLFAKGVLSAAYWRKVYRDCENMYPKLDVMIGEEKSRYNATRKPDDKDLYTLQHWCTDMWCVLWNLWLMGAKTVCDRRLSFSWATSSIDEYDKHAIYHDAGVTANRKGEMFFKGGFSELPAKLDTSGYRQDMCSIKYVEYVKRLIDSGYGG
jgi:hypothetical protein